MPEFVAQVPALGLQVRPTAALIGFAGVLELTADQVAARIMQALAENPALERDERGLCRCCGEPTGRARCYSCTPSAVRGHLTTTAGEMPGPARNAATELLEDLRVQVPARDGAIAEFLVFNLGARGLLEVDVPDVVAALRVPAERVEQVLRVLQELGPPGLGARTARECLRLQLDHWERAGDPQPVARAVIERHLADVAAGRLRGISRDLGVEPADVRRAVAFIRQHLRAFPAIDLSASSDVGVRVAPDAVISRDESRGYRLDLLEPHRFSLRVRPLGGVGHDLVREARLLVSRLEQRWQTLRTVGTHLLDAQRGFLDRGPAHLVPLTRATVAAALGMHESTISRCVAGRHVMLPSRQVVPLSAFFPTAPGAREALRRILRAGGPYTDRELVDRLSEQGFSVARRTVAKYRAQLGVRAGAAR